MQLFCRNEPAPLKHKVNALGWVRHWKWLVRTLLVAFKNAKAFGVAAALLSRHTTRAHHHGTPILTKVAEAVDAVVPTVMAHVVVLSDAVTEIDVMNDADAV